MTDGVCKACKRVVPTSKPVCPHRTTQPWVVAQVKVLSTGQPALHGTAPRLGCSPSQHHESQNHRMVGVGRDLCGSSSPTLLPKQGHLQQAAQ